MNGILNIHKPPGLTSFAVVARVKRITGEKHTGHAGTLDPLASGVLPVCLGQATRVIEYLFAESKTYRAEVRLGLTTDSYDITGRTLSESDPSAVTEEQVKSVLDRFRGTIQQVPPMFSALKHSGQPLYKLARAGQEVERTARTVHIYRLEMDAWRPPAFNLIVDCSKGTYIRSLVHDIGQGLGCGAVMQDLVRERVGVFNLSEALSLEKLESVFQQGCGENYLYAPDYALVDFPVMIVNPEQQCLLVKGMPLPAAAPSSFTDNSLVRLYNQAGEFVGMARYVAELQHWQPHKIFLKACCQTPLAGEN